MIYALQTLGAAFLWPGTKACQLFGRDPREDMGLLRSFFNFLFWLPFGLIVTYLLFELNALN